MYYSSSATYEDDFWDDSYCDFVISLYEFREKDDEWEYER